MGDCCEETCNEEYSFYPCGANQEYQCDPKAIEKFDEMKKSKTNPTGSAVFKSNPRESPFYFHDGFEAAVFDPLKWRWHDGDASWELEREAGTASEGMWYTEARTQYIANEVGTAELSLTIESPNGGTLSYQIQALIQAPIEDVLVEVDGEPKDIILNTIGEWTTHELEIMAGRVVVSWVHRKNPSDMSAEELARFGGMSLGITRIDDVTFLPK